MVTTRHSTIRIDTRLDEGQSAKVERLKRATGLSTSDLVRRGIDLLYAELRPEGGSPLEIFSRVGFLGSGEGPKDLSVRYKDEFSQLLDEKHGNV